MWRAQKVKKFLLPGEQKNPSTAELERDYLLKNGVQEELMDIFTNRNGTVQQLEPIARMQREKRLGRINVLAFAFHIPRTQELIKALQLNANVLEVEETYIKLRYPQKTKEQLETERYKLINAPFMKKVEKSEQGIVKLVALCDRPFGTLFPLSRLFKLILGPTITDRDYIGLVRIEQIKRILSR